MTRTSFRSERIARRRRGRQIRKRTRIRRSLSPSSLLIAEIVEIQDRLATAFRAVWEAFKAHTSDAYTLAPPAPGGRGARRQLLSNGRKP